MKKKNGFTLIEIVMVLVLLGILSAIAVPKYFDLQEKAREKAAHAISQEFQARLNGVFAQWLLEDKACSAFISDKNNQIAAIAKGMNDEGQFLSITDGSSEDDFTLDVAFDSATTATKYSHTIYLPKCASDTE